jgi:hypothetical protein
VWLFADTSIVEDILELKQNIRVYFYLRYRRKKTQYKGLPVLAFVFTFIMNTTLIGCYGISPQYTYHPTNLEAKNELTFKTGISVRDVTKIKFYTPNKI